MDTKFVATYILIHQIYSRLMRYNDMTRFVRHITFGVIMFLMPLLLQAETVSQKEASRIAEKFFNAAAGQVMAKPKLVYNGKRLTTDRLFTPFYVYNHPAGGSVIISAENKAMPILGYSLKSGFSPDHQDAEINKLLSQYAKDIEYIRYDSRIPSDAIAAWTDIPDCIDYTLNRYFRDTSFRRIETDDEVWIMREEATEFPGVAHVKEQDSEIEEEEEYIPFKHHDLFMAETEAEKQKRLAMFDARINITEPVISPVGDGHYQIRLPRPVSMVRLYNMEGALVRMLTFRDTDTAVFNLDSEPRGFYIALLNDIDGHPYGFKIHR